MKIGAAQLNSNDSLQGNLEQMKQILSDAQEQKPAVIFFPENSLYFRIEPTAKVVAVELDGKEISELKALCAQLGTAVHFTTPVRENGKVYNASVFIRQDGQASLVYKKIHLFDIELNGQKPIRESDTFVHGSSPNVLEFQGFKIGNSICYDVRFAELYAAYAKAEVDLIAVPAAFLVKTGQAHWEILLRARAIESQCFVVAPAQVGAHKSSFSDHQRETYGHSMIISPWGEITATQDSGTGVIFAEISHDLIQSVRKQIPMKNHRRIDL